jgi:hypothetical protein
MVIYGKIPLPTPLSLIGGAEVQRNSFVTLAIEGD